MAKALNDLGILSTKLITPGDTGWPDRVFWLPTSPVLIEFKLEGEVARKKQVYVHELLRRLNYEVHVCDNTCNAIEILSEALWRRLAKK